MIEWIKKYPVDAICFAYWLVLFALMLTGKITGFAVLGLSIPASFVLWVDGLAHHCPWCRHDIRSKHCKCYNKEK